MFGGVGVGFQEEGKDSLGEVECAGAGRKNFSNGLVQVMWSVGDGNSFHRVPMWNRRNVTEPRHRMFQKIHTHPALTYPPINSSSLSSKKGFLTKPPAAFSTAAAHPSFPNSFSIVFTASFILF